MYSILPAAKTCYYNLKILHCIILYFMYKKYEMNTTKYNRMLCILLFIVNT